MCGGQQMGPFGWMGVGVHEGESVSDSVLSDSLQPHGL